MNILSECFYFRTAYIAIDEINKLERDFQIMKYLLKSQERINRYRTITTFTQKQEAHRHGH